MVKRQQARPAAATVPPWEAVPRKKSAPTVLARVPLGDGQGEAVLYRRDFDKLRAAGIPLPWFTVSSNPGASCVRCRHPSTSASADHTLSVARLLMACPPRMAVRYRDGDPTNLRKRNLYLADDARAKGRERDVMRRLRERAA